MKCDTVEKPATLVKGIEGKFLDEWYAVNLYVVGLGTELDALDFLASYYGADVGLADADDSVGDAFPDIVGSKVVGLLAIDFW